MISWREFNRLNKVLTFPGNTKLIDAIKIMLIVKRSEEINVEHKRNEQRIIYKKFNSRS